MSLLYILLGAGVGSAVAYYLRGLRAPQTGTLTTPKDRALENDKLCDVLESFWTYTNLFYQMRPVSELKKAQNFEYSNDSEFRVYSKGLFNFFQPRLQEPEFDVLSTMTTPSNESQFGDLFEEYCDDEDYHEVLQFLDVLQARLSYYNLHCSEFRLRRFLDEVADYLKKDWDWDERAIERFWSYQNSDEVSNLELESLQTTKKDKTTNFGANCVFDDPFGSAPRDASNHFEPLTTTNPRKNDNDKVVTLDEFEKLRNRQYEERCTKNRKKHSPESLSEAKPVIPDHPYDSPSGVHAGTHQGVHAGTHQGVHAGTHQGVHSATCSQDKQEKQQSRQPYVTARDLGSLRDKNSAQSANNFIVVKSTK